MRRTVAIAAALGSCLVAAGPASAAESAGDLPPDHPRANLDPGPGASPRALPSGRTTYRHLADYTTELHALASANPELVKLFTLPHRSWQGRTVEGIEITPNPSARDGKPVFLLLGLHHANEWPSGEHAIEFAHELVNAYRAGDPRTTSLLQRARVIVVPVVNPDGFVFSREAPDGTAAEEHRKNCRPPSGPGGCQVNHGVDLNRNYSSFWGGGGSSTGLTHGNYRGPAPFSEPEAMNIRDLIASRQVTGLITNHTSGRLILRQPGVIGQPPTPDEAKYRALGDSFAAENGYRNQFSYELYDHGGTTDNWGYYVTGGFGYVFEISTGGSHAAYSSMAAEYEGTSGRGGNREAYYKMLEYTADPAGHSVLTGSAPPGAVLRLGKSFTTATQVGTTVPETLSSTIEVPGSGRFEWHVNQSTRPFAVQRGQRESWTLSCELPEGQLVYAQQVEIARGQVRELGNGCAPPPPPADSGAGPGPGGGAAAGGTTADARTKPRLMAKAWAIRKGTLYRVRVRGWMLEPNGYEVDGARCPGSVRLTVTSGRRKIASGRAPVDGACGFERKFALRTRRPFKLVQGLARYGGSPALQPAERALKARVKRR